MVLVGPSGCGKSTTTLRMLAGLEAMNPATNVGVRPEAWRLVSAEEGGLPVQVTVVEELGADGFAYGTCDVAGTPGNVTFRVAARDSVRKGETIHVTTDPRHVHVFDTDSGERLSD